MGGFDAFIDMVQLRIKAHSLPFFQIHQTGIERGRDHKTSAQFQEVFGEFHPGQPFKPGAVVMDGRNGNHFLGAHIVAKLDQNAHPNPGRLAVVAV